MIGEKQWYINLVGFSYFLVITFIICILFFTVKYLILIAKSKVIEERDSYKETEFAEIKKYILAFYKRTPNENTLPYMIRMVLMIMIIYGSIHFIITNSSLGSEVIGSPFEKTSHRGYYYAIVDYDNGDDSEKAVIDIDVDGNYLNFKNLITERGLRINENGLDDTDYHIVDDYITFTTLLGDKFFVDIMVTNERPTENELSEFLN